MSRGIIKITWSSEKIFAFKEYKDPRIEQGIDDTVYFQKQLKIYCVPNSKKKFINASKICWTICQVRVGC